MNLKKIPRKKYPLETPRSDQKPSATTLWSNCQHLTSAA